MNTASQLNEGTERRLALEDHQGLDTSSDSLIARIVELAAQICEVPIALVSLVDGDGQQIKAYKGLEGRSETAGNSAFCKHAIRSDVLMEVADAAQDVRFAEDPLVVSGPMIRFYAGIPLINSKGNRLGTLGVMDRHSRHLHNSGRRAFHGVSQLLVSVLENHEATRRLLLTEERFDLVLRATDDVVWDWDLATGKVWVNDNYERMIDVIASDRDSLGTSWTRHLHPDDRSRVLSGMLRTMASEAQTWSDEYRIVTRDGAVIDLYGRGYLLRDASGKASRVTGIAQDISGRKRSENALLESERFVSATLNALTQHLCVLDETGTIVSVNNAWTDFATANGGHPTRVSEGANYLAACDAAIGENANEGASFAVGIRAVLSGELETFELEYPCHGLNQQRWFSGKVVRIAGDGPRRVVVTHSDISERMVTRQKMLHQTHYDALTDLPNRTLFHDRLALALTQGSQNGWITAVLFIDLDRFKVINDTLGHGVGDRLLQLVSRQLQLCLRDGDLMSRLGGDEFAMVLANLVTTDDASLMAERVIEALSAPFDLNGTETWVTASIGIAIHPGDGEHIDTLIKNADAAMYSAKALGGNNYQFYTEKRNQRALDRMHLESSLRHALDRGEFLLHYQPKVAGDGKQIHGAEALLRWNHPERGMVSPEEFIPILEQTGFILPVGLWVMETACAQIQAWQRSGLQVPSVAINLSARQFQLTDLDLRMRDIIESHGIRPDQIELEITESMLMHDPQQAARILRKLKQLGVQLAIDDFGTGYSSLAYLKRFPLDALKIDRAFISNIPDDDADAAITLTIINLAHNLKLKVVAEGVETEAQMRFLQRHGCDLMQGYHFSPGVDADTYAQMLRTGSRLIRSQAA